MSVGTVLAEEEEEEDDEVFQKRNSGYGGKEFINEHMDIGHSVDTVESGPMGSSVKMVNSYAAYGYIAAIALVILSQILKFRTGDGKQKAEAFLVLIMVGLFVMAQWGILIMCLDTIAGTA
jgi:hypothetical protein